MNGPKVIQRRHRPRIAPERKYVQVPLEKSRNVVDFAYLISNLKRIQQQLNHEPNLNGAATRSLIDFATELLDDASNKGKEIRASLIEDVQTEHEQTEGTNVLSFSEYRKRLYG